LEGFVGGVVRKDVEKIVVVVVTTIIGLHEAAASEGRRI
jgi:hypothetical protein